MSLVHAINQAKEFGFWLHEKTNDRKGSGGVRERTGESILQLSLDLDDAILVLLEAGLPGPALALGRPLFEGYVRGVWLLRYASDKDIERFINGKCPRFHELLLAIGSDETSGGAWIHNNRNVNWRSFNDLTHGGSEHVKRRITEDLVEPNYPEQELETLVRLGVEIRIRIGCELLSLMNDEIAMEQLNERARIFRLSP